MGNHLGTPGGKCRISMYKTVMSENTNTSQAMIEPRKSNLIMAFVLSTLLNLDTALMYAHGAG